MKRHTSLLKFLCRLFTAAAVLAAVQTTRAGLAIPYTANADTLHLWHLNETNGSFYAYDSADLDTNSWEITLTNIGEPNPVTVPTTTYTNASFGNPGPGFPGLTNVYSGSTKQHLLYGGSYPNVNGLCNPTTGAYTFEALIMLSNSLAGDYEILTGDTGGGLTTRGWQWRFNTAEEQWDLLGGGTDNNFIPLLPTTGVDAAALNTWYHVAVTFTGQSPTNADPTNQLKLYWTKLDPARDYADVLITENNVTNAQMPDGIRPLNGAPEGTTEPNIGVGGSGRSTSNPGNNEGLVGSICEVRVTDLCLQSNQMAFYPGGIVPPFNPNPLPPSVLVGYGQPLNVTAPTEASQPASYFWYQNGTLLPSQTAITLDVPSATFASGGSYDLVVTNVYGAATTSVMQVTIGAIADELFSTGIVSNQVSSGDVPDPNYTMVQSSNPSFLGPVEMIWESNCPIEFICSAGGGFAPAVASSMWISDQGNAGGNAPGDPTGTYIIRTHFLLDQASPTNLFYQSGFELDGTLTNILLNGNSTGFNMQSVAPLYANQISMSNYNGVVTFNASGTAVNPVTETATNANFFVPGLNTLDFVVYGGFAAVKVDSPTMIGYALPAGLPTILQQPASAVVRDANLTGPGSDARFSVVTTGRPPLTYQWYSNGFIMPGVTSRTINYTNPAAGLQGTNFQVVVSNSSGSVTSLVAALTLVATNQPPVCPPLNIISIDGQGAAFYLSYLVDLLDSDPDGDAMSIPSVAGSSTTGASVNENGATVVYTPNQGYTGADQFTYAIQDANGATNEGDVNILDLAPLAPFTTVLVGGTTNLSVGVSTVPSGYSFQWQFYGTNLPGATSAQLVITNAQQAIVGPYTLTATGTAGSGSVTSTTWLSLNGVPKAEFDVNAVEWVFNGYGGTPLATNSLQLTDGGLSEARSAWFVWPQDISSFNASFVYQDVGGTGADGFTFVLQNTGTAALGAGGGSLAYTGIQNSIAFEFNIYSNNTVGFALQSDGTVSPPYTPTTPVNIASGDRIAVSISYSNGMGQLSLTDLKTSLSTNIAFNATNAVGDSFENIIGTNVAYVGFTGGDGAVASTQTISNFAFLPPSLPLAVNNTVTNTAVLSWIPPYSGFLLQSASSLSGPWNYVTKPVQAVGEQYQVAVPLSAGAQFYRLILP